MSLPEIVPVLLEDLRLNANQVERLLSRHESLQYYSATAAREALRFLREEAEISRTASLAAAVRANPQLLTADPANLRATLATLKAAVSAVALQTILRACPAALLLQPSEVQERERLFDSIGMSFDKVARGNAPLLIREWHSIKSNFEFLVSNPEGPGFIPEQAARLSEKYPMLLVYDPRRQIAPLVNFLRHRLDLDPAHKECECFYAYPSAEELETTLSFLVSHCGYTLSEVREQVETLAYSFEQCIQPRGAFARRRGLEKPPLAALGKWDDQKFCQALGVQLQDYQEFAKTLRAELRMATKRA